MKTIMKKQYISPKMGVHYIDESQPLMAGSSIPVKDKETSDFGSLLSREFVGGDDEDEYSDEDGY